MSDAPNPFLRLGVALAAQNLRELAAMTLQQASAFQGVAAAPNLEAEVRELFRAAVDLHAAAEVMQDLAVEMFKTSTGARP